MVISPTMSLRPLSALILAACLASLAAALVAQYGFGLQPCILCLTQRVPFVFAALLCAAALVRPGRARMLVGMAGAVLAVNAAIAFYHVGVERHWWEFAVCGGDASETVNLDDIAAAMSRPVTVRCDQPAWAWHGVTMAGLNLLWSMGLGGLALAAALRRSRREG
ncbi:MAG: disulfide bond formation protein B [Magnetospirillum sp.]|nr:disulfide bond formation protein B [Magnetospirillum sp.]